MITSKPKITVLMPAYNAAQYISQAIDSVLMQTFEDFELLIINDGSTDDTEYIIRAYRDKRIRLINQSNQGIAAALNMGLLNATAGMIARFDADDICLPGRLQLQYDFLITHKDHVIVGSDADYIDKDGHYVFTCRLPAHSNDELQALALTHCPFIHSAVLFYKQAVLAAGGYNNNAYAFQDHLLWAKLIKLGKVANLSRVLMKVRLNPGSISIDEKWRTRRFREIKASCLQQGQITEQEGKELLGILKGQDNFKVKAGSYYSLLGKKYLWNNHQPKKARMNLKRAIHIYPARLDSYAILLLSFFPKEFIQWLYKQKIHKSIAP